MPRLPTRKPILISTSRITGHSEPVISSSKTLPRIIDGLELASSIIDDCFELYVVSLSNRHVANATQIFQTVSFDTPSY